MYLSGVSLTHFILCLHLLSSCIAIISWRGNRIRLRWRKIADCISFVGALPRSFLLSYSLWGFEILSCVRAVLCHFLSADILCVSRMWEGYPETFKSSREDLLFRMTGIKLENVNNMTDVKTSCYSHDIQDTSIWWIILLSSSTVMTERPFIFLFPPSFSLCPLFFFTFLLLSFLNRFQACILSINV